MIQLFDKNKRKIAGLVEYKDLCIESVLESGDKTLSFSYSIFSNFYNDIVEETYIRTKHDEFVVKSKSSNSTDNKTSFTCKLNIEEIEGSFFDRFESVEQKIFDCLNLALVGTGWTINFKNCTNNKKRTIRMTNCNSWSVIQKAKKLYGVDIKFDTLNKVILLYDKLGEDKGTYFIDSLNLRALQTQGNSYNFYTRIIPVGKNGLSIASVNDGKKYLDNNTYSKKILTYYWKDERYTNPESLKEDALEKLEEMSKPFRSYIALILNLSKMNEKYKSILDCELGDYIYLVSKKNNVKDKHRIVKTKEYPQDHSRDTFELANKALDLSQEKLLLDEMSTTLDNVTTDNGTVDGSTIDSITTKQIEDFEANVIKVTNLKALNADIENLHTIKADIQDLNAVKARLGTVEITKANITDLDALKANFQQAIILKADITDLNAANGKINVLESKTASIENALNKNLTAENIATGAITAGSGIIAHGAIGDGEISSLSGNKLRFGTIDTSKVTVLSGDGRLKLANNKLQVFQNKDGKLYERIMLGVDDENNSSLVLRGADGKTILLNQDGLTKEGLTDGFNKADDNSLSALKLDKNSIVRQVNGATETIAGTRIQVGDRTLDVELSTQKNTITENSKELSSQKASIKALDNAIKLKVDTQTFTQSNQTINSNINRAKEEALNSAKDYANTQISTVNSNLSKATSELNLLKGQISSKVSQSDVDKSVQNINFNDVNIILNSGEFKDTDHWSCTNSSNNLTVENKILKFKFTNYSSWGCYITNDSLRNKPLDPKKKYTVVCRLKASRKQTVSFNICDGNGSNYVYSKDLNLNEEFQIFKFTFNPAQAGNERQFRFITGNLGYDFDLYIDFVKMVEGSTTSDSWSVAPDYIVNKITNITDKISTVESKLTQETNSIKASVQDLNSTTQTITSSVSNLNRDLTNKINSNLDVAKNFATDIATNKANVAKQEAITGARSIPDTRNDNQSPGWYIKHYPKQTITEFKYANIVQIPGSSVYGTLETKTPWGDSSGGYPTQVFRSNSTATFQRHGVNDTTWSAWEQIEDTQGAQDKANTALNSAKAYTNAEITTVNTKVNNVESSINILKNQISSKVSQSDIDKSISTIRMENIIYARGTGNDYPANSIVKVNGKTITDGQGRGLRINALNKVTLERVFLQDYDTYGSENDKVSFVNKINELNNGDFIIIITSQDASYPLHPPIKEALEKIGATLFDNKQGTYREAYALIGKSKLGRGNGVEMFIPRTANDKRFAEVSVKVGEDGTFIGVNPNNIGLETTLIKSNISDVSSSVTQLKDSVTTSINSINSKTHSIETSLNGKANKQEVTEVNNKIASITANLDGITQRVSNEESNTTSINNKINTLATKSEVAQLKVTANNISSEVSKKVNSTEIISRINQSAEGLRIDANRVDLNGYVTMKNLGTPGQTIIDGRNIKTGFIEAIQLIAPHITGKTRAYFEEGSILSSDGEANFRKFYGMPGGTFDVESEAWFRSVVNAARFRCNGNYVPYSKSGYKWVVESLQGINTPNGDAIEFDMVGGTKFGVNIWYSDARLKTDIEEITTCKTSNNKTGLDLIKSIKHYSFRYKSNLESKIECGYVAQDLQRHNRQVVNSIKQEDGTEILQVDERTLIPNISLAIQQQQKIIERLERRLEELERKLA